MPWDEMMQTTKLTSDFGQSRAQQAAYLTGSVLVLSGLAHIFVWLFDGGSLSGSVSWRKPILFGLSAGVTVLSLAWVSGKWKRRPGDNLLLLGFSAAMLLEVGLISMQQWRGTASHFNRSTAFDANVLLGVELLVIFATFVIAYFTLRGFGPLRGEADLVVAIRGGLVLLLLSCLIGIVIVLIGNRQQLLGQPVEQYGSGGVLKFPHGVPMHAIQTLPLLAWVLATLGVGARLRLQAVSGALASTGVFTLFSLLQTFSGRARFEFWWFSWIVLVAAALLFAIPGWIFCNAMAVKLWRWRNRSLIDRSAPAEQGVG